MCIKVKRDGKKRDKRGGKAESGKRLVLREIRERQLPTVPLAYCWDITYRGYK